MRIVFMGTPIFGRACFEWLYHHTHVVGVVTQPDRPSGRGWKLTPPAIKIAALEMGMKPHQIYQWDELRDELTQKEVISTLSGLEPDFFVVIAYGKILKSEILRIPKKGAVNVHGSLLPKFRGASPIQAALLAGEALTGVCTMQMVRQMDAGDVYYTAQTPLSSFDTFQTVHDRLSQLAVGIIGPTLEGLMSDTLRGTPQNPAEVSYCKKIERKDGYLSWQDPAEVLDRKVRGLNPWPGTFFYIAKKRVLVKKARCLLDQNIRPGFLAPVIGEAKAFCDIALGTHQGALGLEVLHLEGQRPMKSEIFFKSLQSIFFLQNVNIWEVCADAHVE